MIDLSQVSSETDASASLSAYQQRLMRIATYASVITASVLIAVKIVAWFMTGSMSLMATLLDSTMDILASLITFFAVKIALTPADDDHHFGHGKAEYLSVLAQSAFVAGSAIVLLLSAANRMTEPETLIQQEWIGISVMVFSIFATFILLAIQRYVIIRTNSAAIRADSLHYRMDLLTNAAVLLALVLASMGYRLWDNILAMLIGAYMLYSVRSQAWDAILQLMDTSLPESYLVEIEQRALSVEGVLGIHEIRTRVSGSVAFIQMHLDIKGSLPLRQAHDIGYQAKQAVLEFMPGADVIVHLDPED